jgi:hypothetical protein
MNRPARPALTAFANAKVMLSTARVDVREAQDALRAFDRRISREYTALRRWHSSEVQPNEADPADPWVGDITDAEGTHPLRESDWRATVEGAREDTARLRSPLAGKLQAAQARLSYWRSECDRLASRKAS